MQPVAAHFELDYALREILIFVFRVMQAATARFGSGTLWALALWLSPWSALTAVHHSQGTSTMFALHLLKPYDRLETSAIVRNDCIWVARDPRPFARGGPHFAGSMSMCERCSLCVGDSGGFAAGAVDFLGGMPIHAIHLRADSLYKPDCNLMMRPVIDKRKTRRGISMLYSEDVVSLGTARCSWQ